VKFGTRLVHFDPAPKDPYRPKATPIYQTSTFEQESADSLGEYDYSRSGNPTRRVLEDQMASLEHGERAFCFASGMAAITAVMRVLEVGDEIISDFDLYGGTARLFAKVLNRAGIMLKYVDASDVEAIATRITVATKMIYIETPTNPFLRVIDISAIATLAKKHGILFVIDNSVMSPYLQSPLILGADIAIHSATKFLCGHSDVTAGVVVVKDSELAGKVYFQQNAEGTALGPFDSYLLLRGLKTLKIRMDAQQKNAEVIAVFLAAHPKVRAVYYPGLASHKDHAIHMRQARGGGAVLSFEASSAATAKRIAEDSRLFSISLSFGSVQSSISIPAKMSHATLPAGLTDVRMPPDNLLRLSIGIEDTDDLIADLSRSLDILWNV
jgi:cystathionine beta-lyase